MSIGNTQGDRSPHDLSHLLFTAGKIGRLQTLSTVPVIAGDSYEQNLTGSLRLAALRRGLAVDSKVDVFSFYIPYRHIYGENWVTFMKDGINADALSQVDVAANKHYASFLGYSGDLTSTSNKSFPKWLRQGYRNIHNNYFKYPSGGDTVGEDFPIVADLDRDLFGYPVCHLKNIWSSPLPPERKANAEYVPEASGNVNVMNLNAQYAALHTDQERQLFMQRYRDVISNFGGKTHYDADNRPHLLMRSSFWASGYDVDGTGQETLGQFSGRVQQNFTHKVPRFFVPEHGTIWTVAVVRFPATHQKENHWLLNHPNHTYADLAGDPAIVGNQPPQNYAMSAFLDGGSVATAPFAHSQYYRTHPDQVHPSYQALEGYPFLDTVIGFDDFNSAPACVYARSVDYDGMFQTDQLGHWNMQSRNTVTVLRNLPTTRDSAVTSN